MKPGFAFVCRVLILSMLFFSFQTAQAGMIGTHEAVATPGASVERAQVLAVLSRADVAQQLQTLGVDPTMAKERVARLTDQEVRSLAGQLETLPAGGVSDWGWVAIIIIAGVAVWWFLTQPRR